jgi:hypothetical protein
MSLRVIWQYIDRSVTQKILYGPQKFRSKCRAISNIIGLLHEYWWILSQAVYHIAWVRDNIHQYSFNNPFILLYYNLRFDFPYLSLLAQPVTLFVYGPVVYGPSRYLHYCNETCILVMDRSTYCHMTRSDMNYLLYYIFYLK